MCIFDWSFSFNHSAHSTDMGLSEKVISPYFICVSTLHGRSALFELVLCGYHLFKVSTIVDQLQKSIPAAKSISENSCSYKYIYLNPISIGVNIWTCLILGQTIDLYRQGLLRWSAVALQSFIDSFPVPGHARDWNRNLLQLKYVLCHLFLSPQNYRQERVSGGKKFLHEIF